jgi:hypothetical protein
VRCHSDGFVEMTLKDSLRRDRATITGKWFERILDTYPPDAVRFLKRERDRFNNPVGYTFRHETEVLFDAILDGMESERLNASIENIVKIRAVQDFQPSQATAFVFLLKNVVREVLDVSSLAGDMLEELLELESRIDGLALAVFDAYLECRTRIYEIGARELRMSTAKLVERLSRAEEQPPGPVEGRDASNDTGQSNEGDVRWES